MTSVNKKGQIGVTYQDVPAESVIEDSGKIVVTPFSEQYEADLSSGEPVIKEISEDAAAYVENYAKPDRVAAGAPIASLYVLAAIVVVVLMVVGAVLK